MILPFLEDFIFTMRSFVKMKPLRKFLNLQYTSCHSKGFLISFKKDLFKINPSPASQDFVCSLVCFCSWVAYIANTMDPDQIAPIGAVWSGFILFALMVKIFSSAFGYMLCHLLLFLGSLYCKQYGPKSDHSHQRS